MARTPSQTTSDETLFTETVFAPARRHVKYVGSTHQAEGEHCCWRPADLARLVDKLCRMPSVQWMPWTSSCKLQVCHSLDCYKYVLACSLCNCMVLALSFRSIVWVSGSTTDHSSLYMYLLDSMPCVHCTSAPARLLIAIWPNSSANIVQTCPVCCNLH